MKQLLIMEMSITAEERKSCLCAEIRTKEHASESQYTRLEEIVGNIKQTWSQVLNTQ
jgi:hypothetical protein